MISKKHKAIFIHIHKTGGSSIEKKLGLFENLYRGAQDHRTVMEIENIFRKNKIWQIKTALTYIFLGKFKELPKIMRRMFSPEISKKEYDSFYKFTIVRNTWSRVFSWYKNVMRDETHRKNYGIDGHCSLETFILEKLNHKHFNQLSFIKNQNGEVPLNFIGRFENLEKDFAFICQNIGIENPELSKILISGNDHYSSHYDEKTIQLIYDLYKDEIEYFNFKFGE